MSTLFVDTINEKTTNNGVYIPGHALQVVNTTYTARFNTSSQSYVEVTGLTTSITPASTSSKVLIQISVTWSIYGHGGLRVYRSQGGTDTLLSVGDANGNQAQEAVHGYRDVNNTPTTYDSDSASITILDTPATASAVSYKLYAGVPYHSSYILTINRQYSEGNYSYSAGTISTMTLTEIGG
tara:strand:+ start:262 stop:807 length:546 start_codon:yes stop_codon:yes gene_type:complete